MFNFSFTEHNLYYFPADLYRAFGSIFLLIIFELALEYSNVPNRIYTLKRPHKWALLTCVLFAIMVLGKWDSIDFLYFQF